MIDSPRPITVVIPALNEERTIGAVVERCRSSLLVDQVIVVNNGSSDDTASIAAASGAEVVHCSSRGLGYAVKAGLRAAKNRWVLKVDADIRNFATDWIATIQGLTRQNVGMVKSYWDHDIAGWPETYFLIKPMLKRLDHRLASIRMPISGVYAVDRALIDIDVLSDDWAVDLDLVYRVFQAGLEIREVELPVVNHTERPLSAYFGMADELLNYLLRITGRHSAQRLMLVMAHCDDAEIWAGGTVVNHLLDGGIVDLVILFSDENRRREANAFAQSFKGLTIHHFGLDEFTDATQRGMRDRVTSIIREKRPSGLITHALCDPHPDHVSAANLVRSVMMTLDFDVCPKLLLHCNSYFSGQANSTTFGPDTFVDISSVSALKYQLIRNHKSQNPDFWVRMSENIDILNGMRCGVARAEAFERSSQTFYQAAHSRAI